MKIKQDPIMAVGNKNSNFRRQNKNQNFISLLYKICLTQGECGTALTASAVAIVILLHNH